MSTQAEELEDIFWAIDINPMPWCVIIYPLRLCKDWINRYLGQGMDEFYTALVKPVESHLY